MESKYEGLFPPELAHLETSLNDAEQQLHQYDAAIDNLPKDRGYELRFDPPGMDDAASGYNRQNSVRSFNDRKQELISNFNKYIDQELAHTDFKTASNIKGVIQQRLSNGEYKDQGREQLKASTGKVKEADQSMDFMASLHFSQFDKESASTVEKEISQPAGQLEERDFTHSFFDQLSGYHENQIDITSPAIDDINEPDIDLED